jgi:AraC-like DNA-binding protein/tetratricopeptide (TPR) repeat protein
MGGCKGVLLSIGFVLCSFMVLGQEEVDSLLNKSYDELFIELNKSNNLTLKDRYARAIIKKAKKEENNELLIAGYHTQAIIHNDKTMLFYCDSIIALSVSNYNEMYPIEAYQLKGDYFFNKKNYNKALDNYLEVSSLAEKTNNEKYILKSKYDLGNLKRRIDEKEEALILFKEYLSYSNKNPSLLDTLTYLNIISEVAHVYNDFKSTDSSSYYNKQGIKEAERLKKDSYVKHFSLNEGVSHYLKGNYKLAIDSLKRNIPYFESNNISTNLPYAYYYYGKSHSKLSQIEKAVIYYKKVDSLFKLDNAVYSISRDNYNQLISYYKQKRDLENQLYYINTLIKVDSLLDIENLYLNKTIYKEYDIPQLESEKEMIQQQMDENDLLFKKVILAFTILLAVSLTVLFFQYYKKTVYKKKFDKIMNALEDQKLLENTDKEKGIDNDENNTDLSSSKDIKELDISPEIISTILKGLQQFEKQKKYLSHHLTLNRLAKELETNSNYLSKVVNHYKKLSFSNYLNLLRVNYFIDLAKRDPNIRKFTIKAIASEVGFSNSESFSKAFYKHKGIKPSYLIRELEKIEVKD